MPIEDKHIIYRSSDPESDIARLAILRVGYSEVFPSFRIKRPAKSSFTMKIVVSGKGMIQSGTDVQSFQAGDILLYWKDSPYEWWTSADELLHHYWIDLDGSLISELFAQTMANPNNPVIKRQSVPREEVALVQNLMLICDDKSPASFWRCLSGFFAVWHSVVSSLPTPEASRNARSIAVSAKAFIDMHYSSQITLRDIAEAVGVAPGYISTVFTETYGLPPYAYAIQCRLQLAYNLLVKGCKVQDAANSVGYFDTSYFTRLFHRRFGCTPSSIIPHQ
jgi:AraC-like DNA-binding protein